MVMCLFSSTVAHGYVTIYLALSVEKPKLNSVANWLFQIPQQKWSSSLMFKLDKFFGHPTAIVAKTNLVKYSDC